MAWNKENSIDFIFNKNFNRFFGNECYVFVTIPFLTEEFLNILSTFAFILKKLMMRKSYLN